MSDELYEVFKRAGHIVAPTPPDDFDWPHIREMRPDHHFMFLSFGPAFTRSGKNENFIIEVGRRVSPGNDFAWRIPLKGKYSASIIYDLADKTFIKNRWTDDDALRNFKQLIAEPCTQAENWEEIEKFLKIKLIYQSGL